MTLKDNTCLNGKHRWKKLAPKAEDTQRSGNDIHVMLSIKRVRLQEGPSNSHFSVLFWTSIYAIGNNSMFVCAPARQVLLLESDQGWYRHIQKYMCILTKYAHLYKTFQEAHQTEMFSNKHFGLFFILKENISLNRCCCLCVLQIQD